MILLVIPAAALLTLFAYVDRLYTEMGKFFLISVEDNLDVFEKEIEPALKMDRGRAGLAFALLTQGMILLLAVLTTYFVLRQGTVNWQDALEALLLLLFTVVIFGHLIPHILITRTTGTWIIPFGMLLRVASLLALPAVAILSFSFTVSDLGKPPDEQKPPSPAEGMEAFMDKGEEHGLLEEEDRRLIQSVVEFGDTTVREVMTPRPKIVAVERNTALGDLLHVISEKHFSRIPVYHGTLDEVEGFVYSRDLMQLSDVELKQLRAFQKLRPLPEVPETKKVGELLRELQGKNLHMAIVVDEYGGVTGLATIEDLVEEIVGEIRDESENPQDLSPQPDGSWVASGHAGLDVLEKAFAFQPQEGSDYTTLAGLVNALAGHVPQRGEAVESQGLRFEVLASSERLVERLRITRV